MAERVHAAAAVGYGRAAGVYEQARPGYPAAAVDWLVERLGADVVELGAGTGRFTAELAARDVRVVAVEPVAAMRARLAERLPSIEVVDATAEQLPFADASVAALVASQSLHWADVDAALLELDRVLAPGGAVGLVWNVRDLEASWQQELDALLAELRGDAPHSRDGRWEAAVERSAFAIGEAETWRWAHPTDADGVVARVRSVSYVGALPEPQQAAVDDRLRDLLDRHGLAGRAFDFGYLTEAYVLRRR